MLFQRSSGLPKLFTVAVDQFQPIRERLRPLVFECGTPRTLFWLCWAAILAGIAIRFPSLAVNAEMYAENGTNLYHHASHSSLWGNLFEFEYYEYLFWFPRLVAIVAVKGLHLRESYPFVTQWFGHVVTGFFYAFFCLARFRPILRSDLARFLLASALGIGLLGTYELYAFVNFPYHGMFLMLILLFSRVDRRPPWEVIGLTLLVFLVGTSKLHPVAFLPFYACGLLLAFRRNPVAARWETSGGWRPRATFLGVTSAALLLQAGTTLAVITFFRSDWRGYTADNPVAELADLGAYYLRTWLHLLFPNDFIDAEPLGLNRLAPWALPPLFAVLAGLCAFHWKRGNRRAVGFFLLCNGLAVVNLAITLCTLSKVIEDNEGAAWFLPFQNRWFYLSLTALFLGSVVLVATAFRHRLVQALVTGAMIAGAIGSNRDFLTEYSHYVSTPEESFSQWSIYAPLTEEPDYAIPLNPHPWILLHNSVILETLASDDGIYALSTPDIPLVRSAVVFESSGELEEPYRLTALDADGREIAAGDLLTPAGYQYPYYHFDAPVRAARFKLVDAAGRPFAGNLSIRFFGPADAPEGPPNQREAN